MQEEILPEQSKEVEASVDHTELLRDLAACDMAAVLIDGSVLLTSCLGHYDDGDQRGQWFNTASGLGKLSKRAFRPPRTERDLDLGKPTRPLPTRILLEN